MKKLMEIQNKISVPKNQRNDFGKYNFRSAEDILSAVKPLLYKHNCLITLTDDIIVVNGWIYVKSTARFTDLENNEYIEISASAREQETVKGMNAAQITGSCSSYARKYALNGLLLLDDVKDPDHHDNTDRKPSKDDKPIIKLATARQIQQLEEWRLSFENKQDFKAEKYLREKLSGDLSEQEAQTLIVHCEAKADNGGQN